MAITALVTQLSGQAWIRGTDGSLTAIHQGSRIPVGAEVVTASGSTVQLQVDGQPPITLGENREFLFSQDVAQNNVDPSEAAVAAPSDPVVDTIIAALNSGADPFAQLDPTAAVLTGGGGEGGASFTRLLSIVESTSPLGLDYPRSILPGVDDVRLSGFGGEVATEGSGATVVQTPADPASPAVPPAVVVADNNSVQVGQLTIAEDAVAPASGTFTITTPGGLAFVTVGSLTLTAAQVAALGQPGATPVEIDTDKGKLVLTGFDAGTGKFSYDYVVDGAQDHSAGDEAVIDAIPIVVTDGSGQDSSGTLNVLITDTNPTALSDDGGSLTEDAALSVISGSVLTNDDAFDAPKTLQSWEEVANKEVIDQLAQLGTLKLNPDGTWSFELDNSLEAVQALAAGETKVFTLQYIMKDADGDTSNSILSFSIVGANDLAVVTPDARSVTEDVGVNLAGRLTVEGAVTITDADAGENVFNVSSLTFTGTDAVGGVQLGNIAMNADGTYTYSVDNSAVQYLSATQSIVETYTVESADGTGTSTITITINGANDAPVIDTQCSVFSVSVSEEGLPTGRSDVAGGEIDTTDSKTATGQVVFSDADMADTHIVTLTAPPGDLYTSNGSFIQWELLNEDHTLNGFVINGGVRTDIISVAVTDTGSYSVTLSGPVDHPDDSSEDVLGMALGVVVSDGTASTATTLTINIEDDSPVITATNPVLATTDDVPSVEFLGSPTPQPIAYATDHLDFAYGADGAGKTGGIALTGAEEGLKTADGLNVVSTVVGTNLIQGHDSNGALVYELHLTLATGQWELFQYQAMAKGNDGMIDFTFKVTDADGDGKEGVFQVAPESGPGAPTLSIGNVEVIEGVDLHAVFTVSLSHASTHDISFDLALIAGTASTPGDYSGLQVFNGTSWVAASSATIAAGQTSVLVRTAITDDNVPEPAEHFTLQATVTDGVVSNTDAVGTGTILDVYIASLGGSQVVEGGNLTFHVELNNAASVSTHFTLVVGGGASTASAGEDYDLSGLSFTHGVTFVSTGGPNGGIGTITIPPGVSSFDVILPTLNDSAVEPSETVRIRISGGGGSSADWGTILDNDEAVQLNDFVAMQQSTSQSHLAPQAGGILNFDDVLEHSDANGGDLLQFLPLAPAVSVNGAAGTLASTGLHGESGAGGSGGAGAHGNQLVIDQIDMGGDHGQAQMVSQMIEQGKLKVDGAS